MKITRSVLFVCLLVAGLDAAAQSELKFNKRFVESEDKWVAYRMNDDSTYTFGFIYIDPDAGLTSDIAGDFKIAPDGHYFRVKSWDSTSLKVRLEANKVLVAWIPESKFEDLKIQAIPEWLKFYKTDTTSVNHLYKWGYRYNGWGECEKALTFLEKALKTDPEYKGLKTELAFSYNCLRQYDKAISILEDLIKQNPTDSYTNKEYVYALVKSKQYEKAAGSIRKAIELCPDQTYNGEMCYNLLYEYYANKDIENFNKWVKETKKWYSKNERMKASVEAMKEDLGEKIVL